MTSGREIGRSWLGAILFGLLAALHCFILGIGMSGPLIPEPVLHYERGEDYDAARNAEYFRAVDSRWTTILSIAGACAVAGAAVAAWGWKASPPRRFHIAYLSGLFLIVASAVRMYLLRNNVVADYVSPSDSLRMTNIAEGFMFTWFAVVIGVMLILVALVQDRRN